jgi:hypothetical protein
MIYLLILAVSLAVLVFLILRRARYTKSEEDDQPFTF